MFVGFNVRVECESLVKTVKFATCSRLARKWTTRERPHEKYMLESKLAKLYFVCHFMTWPTCE